MFFSDKKNESILYGYFHEFHNELMHIKREVKEKDWARMVLEKPFPESLPFRNKLLTLLEKQGYEASARGGEHGAKLFRKLKFLMVALADEFFLHLLEWDGQEVWRNHLLELELFNSMSSGQQFFDQIDELLVIREPVVLELARIYLVILALGFQGKFRDRDDKGELVKYRQRLYEFITRRQPEEAEARLRYDADLRICPPAYNHTLSEIAFDPKKQWLPSLAPWYLAFTLLLLGGLFSSMVLWYDLTRNFSMQAMSLSSNRGTNEYVEPVHIQPVPSTQPAQLANSIDIEVLDREIQARKLAEKRALESARDIEELKRQLDELQKKPEPKPKPWRFTLGDVSFASGQSVLNKAALDSLDELMVQLKQQTSDSTLRIVGYTDSTGKVESNLRLSLNRANAVRDALLERGVEASRITSLGYGASNPLADNLTAEGRSKNRRVEIDINPVGNDEIIQ